MTTLQQLISLFSKLWLLFMVICNETSSRVKTTFTWEWHDEPSSLLFLPSQLVALIPILVWPLVCYPSLEISSLTHLNPRLACFSPNNSGRPIIWCSHRELNVCAPPPLPPMSSLLLTCELDCKDLAHCFPKLYLWPLMWSFFTPTSPVGIEHQSTSTASLWRTQLSWSDLVLNKEHLCLSWLTLHAEPWHRHGYIFICLAFSRVLLFAVFADQGEIAKFYTSKIFI